MESHFDYSLVKTLAARASLKRYLPGSPSIETKRVGQRTVVYCTDTPEIPAFRWGGVTRITLGWVVRRYFTHLAQ